MLIPTKNSLLALALVFAAMLAGGGTADSQEAKSSFNPKNYKGKDDILQSGMTIVDLLIILEEKLGLTPEDWKSYYRGIHGMEFDYTTIDDDARLCILLGIKVADATLAMKAKDAEAVNACATYIEDLARRLDVPEESLGRGYRIKDAVNRNDWHDAFFQLGLYRQDIVRALKSAEGNDRSKAILIVCGAWYYGSSIGTRVIADNYSGELSNYLRARDFVRLMEAEVRGIQKDDLKKSNEVKYLLATLPNVYETVNISRDWWKPEGQIDKETLGSLRKLANGLVNTAISGQLASLPQEKSTGESNSQTSGESTPADHSQASTVADSNAPSTETTTPKADEPPDGETPGATTGQPSEETRPETAETSPADSAGQSDPANEPQTSVEAAGETRQPELDIMRPPAPSAGRRPGIWLVIAGVALVILVVGGIVGRRLLRK